MPVRLRERATPLLDEKLDEITDAVHGRDSDRLVANRRFLEERFGKSADGLSLPHPE
jgi:hypothetical protein